MSFDYEEQTSCNFNLNYCIPCQCLQDLESSHEHSLVFLANPSVEMKDIVNHLGSITVLELMYSSVSA